MILLIDNYDSFVFNLARYLENLGQPTQVVRNDRIAADDVARLSPAAVVLSPGPCTPNEAGCCLEVVRRYAGQIPMLGVCLGHQTIAQALGGRIVRAEPMHGKASAVLHRGEGLFAGLPTPFAAGRYHSLVVEPRSLPPCLEVTAWTEDGTIMGLAHREATVYGVQFHPESILTEAGYPLLANFLRLAGLEVDQVPEMAGELKRPAVRVPSVPTTPIPY